MAAQRKWVAIFVKWLCFTKPLSLGKINKFRLLSLNRGFVSTKPLSLGKMNKPRLLSLNRGFVVQKHT